MKAPIAAIVTIFFLFCSACFSEEPIESVSLIRLIANPQRYDGKLVRVEGFMRLQFEGNALYLHREDWENTLMKNAVILVIKNIPEMQKYDRKYVFVEGVFREIKPDSFQVWSGYIEGIRRVEFTK